jgi:hypothetical protein
VPKAVRIILAVLLLAIPVAWWGLRALPEEPSPAGTAHAPPRPSSSTSPGPESSGNAEEVPEDGLETSEEEEEDELLEEDELAGPGPCLELEVTAGGAPVKNAQVTGVRLEEEDISYELSPISVGPEGRRQAWCKPGEYRLAAIAPGLAPSTLALVVKEGDTAPVARFALGAGHTLSGRVLDKDSEEPIPGAKLTLSFEDEDFDFLVTSVSVTSDARGNFRVGNLAAGSYRIDVEAPGHTEASKEIAIPRMEPLSIELDGTCRLEGQVVDGAGAPVPGAELSVLSHGRLKDDTPRKTDAQGRFSLEVEEGTYVLAATVGALSGVHEGGVTVARGGLVDGLIIRLSPTGSLAGKVFVQSSHEPIGAAMMSIIHVDSQWSRMSRTDASGGFRFEHLLPGAYTVSVFKGNFSDTQRDDVRVQANQEASVEFSLVHQARLEGSVTDGSGRPAQGASIVAQLLPVSPKASKRLFAETDESGQYRLSGLSPGSYRVEARLTRSSQPIARELTFQEGEKAHADFALPDSLVQVEGRVQRTRGGPPVHPVDVQISSEKNVSTPYVEVDEQGHFTVQMLPGAYTFSASTSDTDESGSEQSVTVEAGKVSRVELTVPDSVVETSGVVLNSRGEPVTEASVTLEDEDELYAYADTDGRGRFTLKTSTSSMNKLGSLQAESGPEEGALQNVRVGSRNVVVRLQKAAALRGRIIAARGAPVQGFELRMERVDRSSGNSRLDSRPFAADTFELVDLPTGAFLLRVRTSDGRSGKAKVQVAPGQTGNVEISVGVLGSVTGRFLNESGAPVRQWVHLAAGTPDAQGVHTTQEGRFEFVALEAGKHFLTVPNKSVLLFELREGETLDLGELGPSPLSERP